MEQFELLRYTIETLERLLIPYALVGSFGSGIYGEPRFTRDIDIIVDLAMVAIPGFCAAFPNGEFYLSESAVRDAVRDRFQFNVIHPASGNKIDFILTRNEPWHAGQVSRRRRVTFGSGEQSFSGF